ncbi:MAG TPA: XRE family transcriptional regulator [Treponema sp.]|nr:XRE family transcriptional regulator [Treponema sp.]
MSLKTRLRNIIKFKGLLMKQVARCAGVKESTFLSYVDARGRIPPADVAVRIANSLGVSVEYLVTGADTHEAEAENFYRKYKRYEDILRAFDKVPESLYNPAKTSVLMTLYGYTYSDCKT